MSYSVWLDDTCIFDPENEILLENPTLELADNTAGSFSFQIYKNNPGYSKLKLLTGILTVKWEEEILYCGRILSTEKGFDQSIEVTSEGELAYLDDTVQRPAEYHDLSVYDFLSQLIELHNSQVEENKQFEIGAVTVTDPNDSLYRYTNWESTLTVIQQDLLEPLGGHLRVRYLNGRRFLDYLAEYPRLSQQKIEFGQNLLSYSETYSGMDLATVCIPLGAKQEESTIEALEERLTIAPVNSGDDYLELPMAIESYGRIVKTIIWDDVHTPEVLKAKGEKWLADNQYEDLELSLSAVDLADFGIDTDHLRLLDRIHCSSKPHGMDHEFPLTDLKISLNDPKQNVYTLGSKARSFSSSSSRSQKSLQSQINNQPSKSHVLKQALDNATQLITMVGKDGYVIFSPSISESNELYITDYPNLEEARRCWRWNLNGLGYSSNGIDGPFELAITMDGVIAGRFIAAGTIGADQIDVDYTSEQEKKWQDKLGNEYWTKTVTETQIKNSSDTVLISAKQYTDDQLKGYETKAEIKVKVDEIEASVSQKVGANEIINAINISNEGVKIKASKFDIDAETVRMKWNESSKYMEFSSGGLSIYESSTSHTSGSQLMRMDENGMVYWRGGYSVGHIGANHWKNMPSVRGLDFDLDYNGSYMTWGYQSSSGSDYIVKLTYAAKKFGDFAADHFYFGSPVDFIQAINVSGITTFANKVNFNHNTTFQYYPTFEDGIKLDSSKWIECTSASGSIYIRNPIPYSSSLNQYGANYTSIKIPSTFYSSDPPGRVYEYYSARVINGIIYHTG